MADQLGGLEGLFQNKLFLQYLSGMGGALSAGEPIGPALNQVTQQNISAQNFNKLLAKLMGDAANPETPGKVSFDGTKLTYNTELGPQDMSGLGKSILGEQEKILGPVGESGRNILGGTSENTALATAGSKLPGGSGKDWSSILNPSSSAAINGADLAGLTPQDISQALRFKMAGEEMEQKKISDFVDMIYKSALMEQAYASAEKARRPEDERTAEVKNYEYYVNQQRALGKSPKTIDEWNKDLRTTHQKDYDRAVDEGYKGTFPEWVRDITALSGGLDLGEFKKRKEATADIEAKKYFTDPKGLVADVDKHVASEEIQNQLFQYSGDTKKREVETVRAKEKFIRGKIAASGGAIVDEKLDGRTFVFKVKWNDGSTSEVRYAN